MDDEASGSQSDFQPALQRVLLGCDVGEPAGEGWVVLDRSTDVVGVCGAREVRLRRGLCGGEGGALHAPYGVGSLAFGLGVDGRLKAGHGENGQVFNLPLRL